MMMFYISIKFHENILNSFQVIQLRDGRTDRQTDGQTTEAKTRYLHPCQGGGGGGGGRKFSV